MAKTTRPPVVVFLGHIDHGKTSLLDKIRQTQVQASESGGITQHTNAYQVEKDGQKITFIDTPGHKAFENMRQRGAQMTDLAILVIAANEGIMPQTRESLEHIQSAGIPYLIALNKMDLPGAKPEEIKNKLTQFGVVVEDRGGEVVLVPVSAKTGEGIEELLEMVLLVAQMAELDDSAGDFSGIVLESRMDPHRGALATIIIRQGELKKGQKIAARGQETKVKVLLDDCGQSIEIGRTCQPVTVLGFEKPLPAGSVVASPGNLPQAMTPKDAKIAADQQTKLPLVVKADTQGTKEAVVANMPEKVGVVKAGVGNITESDVFFASTCQADIVGFRVKSKATAQELAKREGLTIKTYQIIYKLIEDLQERLEQLERQQEEATIAGQAEIVADFKVEAGRVAGAKVTRGLVKQGARAVILRQGQKVAEVKIASLKHGKKDIRQAGQGREFGAIFTPAVDFIIGDVIKCFKPDEEEVK